MSCLQPDDEEYSGMKKKLSPVTVCAHVKEIWRLRLNWVFITSMALLACLSNQSITSSFHQFITNPRFTDNTNSTRATVDENGLGESEEFYSALITILNVGAIFGGVSSGFLVKCLPYWHLFLFALFTHILGFILYAVTYEGWLILISKFLAGYFIGSQRALALSYATSSSVDYVNALKEAGESLSSMEENQVAAKVRDYLFSAQTIGICLGFFVGPGAAIIFAQLPIDQFRAVAWFNVAFGITFLIMEIAIFRGESSCEKIKTCQMFKKCQKVDKSQLKLGPLQVFIIATMYLLNIAGAIKFAMFETLYNPVLSDSFGLTERISPYFFFSLAIPEVIGVVALFLMQKLKLSNQIIALVGILLTFVGCFLIADWQSIPYDPCTEFSPFHHPEIVNYNSSLSGDTVKLGRKNPINTETSPSLTVSFQSTVQLSFNDGSSAETHDIGQRLKLNCEVVENCPCDEGLLICLSYTQTSGIPVKLTTDYLLQCQNTNKDPLVCIRMHKELTSMIVTNDTLQLSHIQTVAVLPKPLYLMARNKCLEADVPNRQCQWNPSSSISNTECDDCPVICRSKEQSLTFWQFIAGAAVLMVSGPIAWVPVAAMISFQTPRELQEIAMGVFVALTCVGRSIGPLILDAVYEGVQKRTFLSAIIVMATFVPFLVEILVLYPKLGPPRHKHV